MSARWGFGHVEDRRCYTPIGPLGLWVGQDAQPTEGCGTRSVPTTIWLRIRSPDKIEVQSNMSTTILGY